MNKFTEKNVLKAVAEYLEAETEDLEIRHVTDWDTEYYTVELGKKDYIILENEDEAEELAKERVQQDLEDEPELFNHDWLNGIKNTRLEGQSFNEYAIEEAVTIDGFAHFLASYDGDYEVIKHGFVIMRVN